MLRMTIKEANLQGLILGISHHLLNRTLKSGILSGCSVASTNYSATRHCSGGFILNLKFVVSLLCDLLASRGRDT